MLLTINFLGPKLLIRITFILLPIKFLNKGNIPPTPNIIEKVLLQGLNAHLLTIALNNIALLINLKLEQIHPLYSFELIFNEHFVE